MVRLAKCLLTVLVVVRSAKCLLTVLVVLVVLAGSLVWVCLDGLVVLPVGVLWVSGCLSRYWLVEMIPVGILLADGTPS